MSLELLEAHETDNGMAVTFAALGQLNEHERVWVEEVPVGRSRVKLGLSPGGQARVMIRHDVVEDLEA
jgi:hypothetical protein